MIIHSRTWVITTSVGILLGVGWINFGAMPTTPVLNGVIAQFPFALSYQTTLVVSTSPHLEETTEEKQIQQRQESLVRCGPTITPITIVSLKLALTTSAGILLEVQGAKCGALPMIQGAVPGSSALFPFALR